MDTSFVPVAFFSVFTYPLVVDWFLGFASALCVSLCSGSNISFSFSRVLQHLPRPNLFTPKSFPTRNHRKEYCLFCLFPTFHTPRHCGDVRVPEWRGKSVAVSPGFQMVFLQTYKRFSLGTVPDKPPRRPYRKHRSLFCQNFSIHMRSTVLRLAVGLLMTFYIRVNVDL